jgi:hypothetical protein
MEISATICYNVFRVLFLLNLSCAISWDFFSLSPDSPKFSDSLKKYNYPGQQQYKQFFKCVYYIFERTEGRPKENPL